MLIKSILIGILSIALSGCKEESTPPPPSIVIDIPNLNIGPNNPNIRPVPNDPSIQVFKFDTKGGHADVNVKPGQSFILQYYSNPSTGYLWELVGSLPDCIELVSTRDITGPKRPSDFDGCGDDVQLLFSARSACTEKIEYIHTPSFRNPDDAKIIGKIILDLKVESA